MRGCRPIRLKEWLLPLLAVIAWLQVRSWMRDGKRPVAAGIAARADDDGYNADALPGGHAMLRQVQPKVMCLDCNSTIPQLIDFCDTYACNGVLKVISVSLYGSGEKYVTGAVRNSEIVKDVFPDWQMWIYIPDANGDAEKVVPDGIKEKLIANGAVLKHVSAEVVARVRDTCVC